MSDEEMVAYLDHCLVEPRSRPPSIETLLHAFLPAANVDHVHADAICALTNHPGGRAAVADALGTNVGYVPYIRPGFELSARVAEMADADAVVLGHHGLVTWGRTGEESLRRTVDLAARATAYIDSRREAAAPASGQALPETDALELLQELRAGLIRRGARVVLQLDRAQRALADRDDVEVVATAARATPDHILRIGRRSAVIRSAADVEERLAAFCAGEREYTARHVDALPPGLPFHSPLPRVVLVPGLGCVGIGRDERQATVNVEIARRSHLVTAAALDAFGSIAWLDEDETFAFDYWPMELRKLALAPPPPRLAATVAVVVGEGAVADAVGDGLREQGASVAGSVSTALVGFGGVDVIVGTDAALLQDAVAAAKQAWRTDAVRGTVISATSSDDGARAARAGSEISLDLGPGADAAAVARAVCAIAAPDSGISSGALVLGEDRASAGPAGTATARASRQ